MEEWRKVEERCGGRRRWRKGRKEGRKREGENETEGVEGKQKEKEEMRVKREGRLR